MGKTKSSRNWKTSLRIFFTNRRVQLVSVVLMLGAVGYSVVLLSNAAAPVTNVPGAPSIYLAPTSQSLAINSTFTVQVRVNVGTATTNAVQANFTYPIDKVTWVSTDYSASAFGYQIEDVVNAATGQVKIARTTANGAALTGDVQVAVLTFRSNTVGGVANLNFSTGTAVADAVSNDDLLPGTSAWGNAAYTVDTTGPVVSVAAPSGAIQYGSQYTINATATDAASDVTKVEIYIDGVLKVTDTASPYSYTWNTTGVTEGAHVFTAKAYDTYNNATTSTAVNTSVKDSIAPTVSVTAPAANANLAGTIPVTATAADNTGGKGLTKVEFYIDNVLKSTVTASPYTFSLDTKTLTDATHAIVAKAYDASVTPNIGTSATVTVTVDNADRIAPTAPANLRSTSKTFADISLAWDASTDNIGVTGYRLTRNGTVIYTGTALSFADTGLAASTTYNYSVVALDARGNVSVATTLSIATSARKIGDINGDNQVGILDMAYLAGKWGTNDSLCDLKPDGIVNILDVSVLASNWGK
jgi:Bacterial Ig domain